jgi:CheY-like chemotaxis protein
MSEEVQAHAFEPFFTTKDVGKGTGLGLATCYGIIKQAEGDIWLETGAGRGTVVSLYLPAVTAPAGAQEKAARPQAIRGGTETVLLVEDEPLVRDMVGKALTKLGYTVLIADGGSRALRMAAEHEGVIHLLVTDVVMPLMGGKEVAERVAAQRPELKVLFMSGYTEDAVIRQGLPEGISFLSKPFTARALAAKVRELLDGPSRVHEQQ